MLRLLIADDEKAVRETMNTVIDWKSLNIEVVSLCKNGLEAYDAILDKYPDIVLTDIQMPKLSGLELIQRITQNHDNIQFIILSGYNDFSYAKEAMRYGIKHYILKPCSENEIISAIKEVIKDYYQKKAMLNIYLDSDSQHFRESMTYDMLLHVLASTQSLEQISSKYETYMDFYHTGYQLYYLFYIEESMLSSCLSQLRQLMETKQIPYIYTFIYVTNTLLFFFPDVQRDFSEIDALLFKQFSHTYKRESFANLFDMLDTLQYKVKRYATISLYSSMQNISICNYNSLFLEIIKLADNLFQTSDDNNMQNILADLNKLLLSVSSIEFLRSTASSLLLQSIHLSNFYNMNETMHFIMSINKMTDYKEIICFITEKLKAACISDGKNNKIYKPFIQEILTYTSEHISSPELTLKWIVENHLYMNVDYVSRQFVLQTGIKFSTYLNELRIKKAKELLANCDHEKIYSVAEQIGCGNNPQYFSHLFKKYTQMTPKEYIQKIKKE